MDDNFHTSQQKAEEHSTPESGTISAPAVQYGTDSPGPRAVTEPVKGEIKQVDFKMTSQQEAGEHHKPEGK